MAKIDGIITHRLALEVVGNREELEVITLQNVEAFLNIRGVFGSTPHV
jgi:hypothetical protein